MTTPDNTPRLSEAELEGVMRRVQKLLAIAQDDRANPAEAAAAASQAEKIMRKYQLDNADIISANLQRGGGDDMATADVVATAKDNGTANLRVPTWAGMLAYALATLHECGSKVVWVHTGKGEHGQETVVRFYGYKLDVQVCAWTFEYLVATVNRLCREFRKHPAYLEGGRSVMHSYRNGVVQSVLSSINALRREKEREQQAAVNSRALVVLKKALVEERFGADVTEPSPTNVKSKDVDAYVLGRVDGGKVDVQRRAVGHAAVNPAQAVAAPVLRLGSK